MPAHRSPASLCPTAGTLETLRLLPPFPPFPCASAPPLPSPPDPKGKDKMPPKAASPSPTPSAFHSLATPLERAQYSVPLFLSHYFLNGEGQPDPSRTPRYLTLRGTSAALDAEMMVAAGAIVGLWCRVCSGTSAANLTAPTDGGDDDEDEDEHDEEEDDEDDGDNTDDQDEGSDKVLYIGWSDPVLEAARRSAEAAERARLAFAAKARAEAAEPGEHEEYLQSLEARRARDKWEPVGRYLVDCPCVDEQWDEPDKELSIRRTAVPGVYEAAFSLGVLEGAMLLSTDRDKLVEHKNSFFKYKKYKAKTAQFDWDYLLPPGAEKETTKKRKRQSAPEELDPRRFYLIWQGIETGEGEYQSDWENNHTGCIEFSDDRFVSFKAEMNMEFVGGDDMFYGKKVSDTPSKAKKFKDTWKDWQFRFSHGM